MRLDTAIDMHAKSTSFRKVLITRFTSSEEEEIRALLSRIPPQLLKGVNEVRRAAELQPIHGKYIPDQKLVLVNPGTFRLRQKFGSGPGKFSSAELMIVHEVGHAVFEQLSTVMKATWWGLSGWVMNDGEGQAPRYVEKRAGWPDYTSAWTHKKGIKFPRKYSEKNPGEDFSDSFAYYILGKGHQLEPSKKEFIQYVIKHFVTAYPKIAEMSPELP